MTTEARTNDGNGPMPMAPPIRTKPGYLAALHHRLHGRRPAWLVYSPRNRDYPGRWVARMHVRTPVPKPTRFVMTHDELDQLRAMLPAGLTMIPRDPSDPYGLVETWL